MAALLIHRAPAVGRHSRAFLVTGIGLTALILLFRGTAFELGLTASGLNATVLALGTAALLVAFHENPSWSARARLPIVATFRWFGQNSYEIYLSHLFLVLPAAALFTAHARPRSNILPFYALVLTASGALGWLLARYYSQPLNTRLRERLLTGASDRALQPSA